MFKVRLKERLFIIFFACFLAIYPPTVKYQEVQALEWAIPTVAFDTALKFLLGLLGVSITSKALHDNVDWSQVQQDCIDYQIQKGNDAVAVGKWWEDVAKGSLNQASDCWSSFKEWVKTMLNSETATFPDYQSVKVSDVFNFFDIDTSTVINNSGISFDTVLNVGSCYYSAYYSADVFSSYNAFRLIVPNTSIPDSIYFENYSNGLRIYYRNCKTYSYNFSTNTFASYTVGSNYSSALVCNLSSETGTSVLHGFLFNVATLLASFDLDKYFVSPWELTANPDTGIFDSANDNIQDTAITTDDTTTTAIPDTLPLPWDNVSDTAEGVSDAIDAVQELVAEGVISLEEYWERVQEMVNALVIDTATDETLPVTQNSDTGETEKLPDKVQENVSNTAFTLNGLEKVFPFCIPWDIYGFVTLLVAEPVAPVINYPFYNPVTNQNMNISIDFSDWENVVVLFRYILDFLLIIGLLLLARQLSGAGGDD